MKPFLSDEEISDKHCLKWDQVTVDGYIGIVTCSTGELSH